jgi:hypothetical protein
MNLLWFAQSIVIISKLLFCFYIGDSVHCKVGTVWSYWIMMNISSKGLEPSNNITDGSFGVFCYVDDTVQMSL